MRQGYRDRAITKGVYWVSDIARLREKGNMKKELSITKG